MELSEQIVVLSRHETQRRKLIDRIADKLYLIDTFHHNMDFFPLRVVAPAQDQVQRHVRDVVRLRQEVFSIERLMTHLNIEFHTQSEIWRNPSINESYYYTWDKNKIGVRSNYSKTSYTNKSSVAQ